MTTGKKGAIIFLWILNILNVLAGFISQFKILLGKDITSIIRLTHRFRLIKLYLSILWHLR